MKKANITIPFDDEKLRATRFYAHRKDVILEDELEDFLQKTYEKYVPKDTREYLEQNAEATKSKPKAAVGSAKKLEQPESSVTTPIPKPQS